MNNENNQNNDFNNTNISSSLLNKNKEENQINTITLNNTVTPTVITNENINPIENEYKKIIIESKDNKNLLFLVIILLLIAILMIVVMFFLLPNIKKETNSNSTTSKQINITTTKKEKIEAKSININDIVITSAGEFKIDEIFSIKTISNNDRIDLYVNNSLLVNVARVYNDVVRIDNLLLIGYDDLVNRTTTLLVVDNSGNIVKKYEYINSEDLKLVYGPSSIEIDNNDIILSASRIDKSILYFNNEVYNICDQASVQAFGEIPVMAKYKLEYEGNNNFSMKKAVEFTTLSEYMSKTSFCN